MVAAIQYSSVGLGFIDDDYLSNNYKKIFAQTFLTFLFDAFHFFVTILADFTVATFAQIRLQTNVRCLKSANKIFIVMSLSEHKYL